MTDSDKRSELEEQLKSGQESSKFGCGIALAGMLIPMVLFSIPSMFPGSGGLQFGWMGIGFAMVVSPLLVIMGIATYISGSRQTSKAEDELGLDSERSPDLNW